ncbi:MAG: PIN domain-containing protein [Candidatus Micrarchaeota archaeon]
MSYENQIIDVEKIISEHVRYFSPRRKNYLKGRLEDFTNKVYHFGEIELQLVVDANMMIAAGIAKCKGRFSFFYELANSPHLKLCAPPTLIQELEKNIPKRAEENKVEASAVKASIEPLLNKVSILKADDPALQKADKLIGARDPGDVSYVALSIHTRSHGVLTNDNDIKELPQIASWNLSGVAKVLTIFENGSFSFHALAFDVPVLLRILYEACLCILGYIWRTITSMISSFAQIVSGGLAAMSKSSALTALVILSVIGVYIYAKDLCVQILADVASKISNFLNSVYNAIKSIIGFAGGLIQMGISVLALLFKNVENTITTYKNLSENPTTVASNFC